METQVKERLTGAIILVVLIVFLVPELLTGPKRVTSTPVKTGDEPPLRSYTFDLNADGNTRTTGPGPDALASDAAPADAAETTAEEESTATEFETDPGDASSTAAEAERPSAASTSAASASKPPSRSETNTPPAATASASRGTTTEQAASKPQPSPSASKPSAQSASKPPAQSSTSQSAAAQPPPRWAVQLGSFASKENADRLARELKAKGFPAYVNEGTGSGKKFFRVRDRKSVV